MAIQLHLPSNLLQSAGVEKPGEFSVASISELLAEIQSQHPRLHRCIFDETGTLRKHLQVFHNSTLVPRDSLRTSAHRLKTGDTVTIWTAVSGG